jgi:pre-mRNA-processing factor 40
LLNRWYCGLTEALENVPDTPVVPVNGQDSPMTPGDGTLVALGGSPAPGLLDSTTPLPASLPPRPSVPVPGVGPATVPEFTNVDDATKAFTQLLRQTGVTPAWTWEQTMRAIITDPMYKALKTLSERKAAFEKYVEDIRRREKELRDRNLERIRPAWREGFGRASEGPDGMKSWWGWDKAKSFLSERYGDMWRMARDDEERKILWEEYVSELRRKEEAKAKELKQRNVDKLGQLISSLQLEIDTPWREARERAMRDRAWSNDVELQQIDMLDFLTVFEENVKAKETEAIEIKAKQREEKRRRQRKVREAYVVRLCAVVLL